MTQQARSTRVPIIGIDLDNTLAIYDGLIHRLAIERGLIQPSSSPSQTNKRAVRDAIRYLPNGEVEWQKLQGLIYGPRMDEAILSPGVKYFFQLCQQNNITSYIISHKTEFANYDDTRTNLRSAAMRWMSKNDFFNPDGLCLSKNAVCFVDTRREKIQTIAQLGCSHFIDDLEEIFTDESFPPQVQKILFDTHRVSSVNSGFTIADSWKEISNSIFPDQTPIPALRP